MTFKWTLAATLIAATGIANANPMDLTTPIASPEEILEAFAPQRSHRGDRDRNRDDKQAEPPKACTDAALTDDQKKLIVDATHQSNRDKVQMDADLKMAFMDYQKTAMDSASDRATADTDAARISDGISKLAAHHLKLANQILYDIAKPEQRANVFMCMKAMHKKSRCHHRQ